MKPFKGGHLANIVGRGGEVEFSTTFFQKSQSLVIAINELMTDSLFSGFMSIFSFPLTYNVRPVYIDFFILFLGLESSFTPAWRTFKHSLYNLTPAERTIKSRKAYIGRISPDGQIMVIAMNQKFAAHNRVMFYSLSQSAVAVIADLKGCGARLNTHGGVPSGRSDIIMIMIVIVIIIINNNNEGDPCGE